jgi:hypothetical protein
MKNLRLAALVSLLTGCSLINSLDQVKPEADNDAGGGRGGKKGSGGSSPMDSGVGGTMTGGKGGGGAGGMSGTGNTGGRDAATDASEGGTGGDAGSGGGGPITPDAGDAGDGGGNFTPGGPGGAIVLYNPTGKNVYVLDPKDGHQLSSEPAIRILAIANDPITDNWYFFRQPGRVSDPAELQVRQLNTTTGAWRDLGTATLVPIPLLPSVGVLNGRIVYLSTPDPASGDQTMVGLTVVDTSNPAKPSVSNTNKSRALPAGVKLGVIANPNALSIGGTATVILQQAMCTGTCDVSLLREIINTTTVQEDSTSKKIGSVSTTGGSIGFAYDYTNGYDVLLVPPADLPAGTPVACTQNQGVNGSALELSTSDHSTLVGPISFDIASLRVSSAAFDSCHKIAFATSLLTDPAIWSIPMVTGGTTQKLCASAGGAMFFEPYTHALLRLPTARMDRFELYDIVDKNPMTPTLTQRNLQLPGGFVFSNVMAVRHPLNPPCK